MRGWGLLPLQDEVGDDGGADEPDGGRVEDDEALERGGVRGDDGHVEDAVVVVEDGAFPEEVVEEVAERLEHEDCEPDDGRDGRPTGAQEEADGERGVHGGLDDEQHRAGESGEEEGAELDEGEAEKRVNADVGDERNDDEESGFRQTP